MLVLSKTACNKGKGGVGGGEQCWRLTLQTHTSTVKENAEMMLFPQVQPFVLLL